MDAHPHHHRVGGTGTVVSQLGAKDQAPLYVVFSECLAVAGGTLQDHLALVVQNVPGDIRQPEFSVDKSDVHKAQ